MAVDSQGAKQQPLFDENARGNTATDLGAVSNYAADFGNRVADTSANRSVFANPWSGLEWFETDTLKTWLYFGAAWHLWATAPTQFLPVFAGGVTQGNGGGYGIYTVANGFLALEFGFSLGSTSAVTGSPGLMLPDSMTLNTISGAYRQPIGSALFYDNSAGNDIYGVATVAGSTTVGLRPYTAGTSSHQTVDVNAQSLFAWAAGDQINGSFNARLA